MKTRKVDEKKYIIRSAHRRALRDFAKMRADYREQLDCQNFEGAASLAKASRLLARDICEDLAAQISKPSRTKLEAAS